MMKLRNELIKLIEKENRRFLSQDKNILANTFHDGRMYAYGEVLELLNQLHDKAEKQG